MQYLSSSTIRCRPRTWPSIRRSRFRWLVFSALYPWVACSVVMADPFLLSYPKGVFRHRPNYPLRV